MKCRGYSIWYPSSHKHFTQFSRILCSGLNWRVMWTNQSPDDEILRFNSILRPFWHDLFPGENYGVYLFSPSWQGYRTSEPAQTMDRDQQGLPPQKPLQEIGFTSFFIGAMVVIIRQHKYNNYMSPFDNWSTTVKGSTYFHHHTDVRGALQ